MTGDAFHEAGHLLVEAIADFYDSLPERELTSAPERAAVLDMLGDERVPESGRPADELLAEVAPLLFDNSLHNGHPRFLGYISASAAPVGALADMLAAALNANVAIWDLSPVASEIESRVLRWIADLIGYPAGAAGIMTSGGNVANLTGFLAARRANASWDIRKQGIGPDNPRLTAYASIETHTWVQKAADVSGIGLDNIRWVDTDAEQRLSLDSLRKRVQRDRKNGAKPFIVVATAGTISTGAVDPLRELAAFCREEGMWLHVDAAYGGPAACLPEAPADLRALHLADSVATDPHKWLHTPIEAACVLTRDPNALQETFGFRPDYYNFDSHADAGVNFFEQGLQNSRGFRALKTWMCIRQAGMAGIRASIRDDISLAREFFDAIDRLPDFEARSNELSITTFRYKPSELQAAVPAVEAYLDELNAAVVNDVQRSGKAFISNAVVDGTYLLRACVVNFRTTRNDIGETVALVRETAARLDREMRPTRLAA
jgi:glutamate/tyrosine decarboxylase-like PLP-dependent enzyme